MKALYISYDGMTDPLGQSQVIPYLIGLSLKGHEIYLISCEKKKSESTEYKEIKVLLSQNNIKWFPLKYTSKPPVVSTIFDIHNINKLARKILTEQNIEIIHCRGYITALTGLKMKLKYGVKFIFDMRGFFADERVDGGLWSLNNPVYKSVYSYFKRKEKDFCINADSIISLTENGKSIINNWSLKSNELPITVIPCCTDFSLFDSSKVSVKDKDTLSENLGIKNTDFIVSYVGSIGTWYLLSEMLDFFYALLVKRKESKFLFITPDSPDTILSLASKKGIPSDCIIIRKANRADVPLLISLSQVSVFFIKPVFSKKASSPTKMGEIMGMGIPVICNADVGDINDILSDPNIGLLVKKFDIEEYNRFIERIDLILLSDPEKIRDAAKKYFSLEDGINKYDNIYKNIVSVI